MGTETLNSVASAAVLRLEGKLPLVRAVTEYETAAVHAVQLAALAESGRMTDLEADSLAVAEDLMAAAKATLAEAGLLHLIGGA